MTASDNFKEQLKAGKIVDALTLALSEAIELDITTWVSTDTSDEPNQPLPGHRMRTRINIVDGDIDNEIGSQFIGEGSYNELREFHQEQVQESRQIMQNNLAALQHLFNVMATTLSQLPSTSRRNSEVNPRLSPSNDAE